MGQLALKNVTERPPGSGSLPEAVADEHGHRTMSVIRPVVLKMRCGHADTLGKVNTSLSVFGC